MLGRSWLGACSMAGEYPTQRRPEAPRAGDLRELLGGKPFQSDPAVREFQRLLEGPLRDPASPGRLVDEALRQGAAWAAARQAGRRIPLMTYADLARIGYHAWRDYLSSRSAAAMAGQTSTGGPDTSTGGWQSSDCSGNTDSVSDNADACGRSTVVLNSSLGKTEHLTDSTAKDNWQTQYNDSTGRVEWHYLERFNVVKLGSASGIDAWNAVVNGRWFREFWYFDGSLSNLPPDVPPLAYRSSGQQSSAPDVLPKERGRPDVNYFRPQWVPEIAPIQAVVPTPRPISWEDLPHRPVSDFPDASRSEQPSRDELPRGPEGESGAQPDVGIETSTDGARWFEPPPPETRWPRPPDKNTKERKYAMSAATLLKGKGGAAGALWLLLQGAGAFTEALDALDALYDALPERIRRAYGGRRWKNPSPIKQAKAVRDHWDAIDLSDAAKNLALNEIQDRIIGKAGKATSQAFGKASTLGGRTQGRAIGITTGVAL